MSNQELWHSSKKSDNLILKADGTLIIKTKENKDSIKKLESPSKEKDEGNADNKPLDMSNNITQAPMYNSPRGGGNRGQFRGGYRDNNRHSYGGQNYNSHDSYAGGGGRHSYGGAGNNRDFGNSITNYDRPMPFPGNPPFRNRNPQHFRNRFPLENSERPPFGFQDHRYQPPRMPPGLPPGQPTSAPSNPGPVAPPPLMSLDFSRTAPPLDNFDVAESAENPGQVENDEECDLYADIQVPSKSDVDDQESGDILLPPPEPPSGLLDYEEAKSERDNDSDQELVIDDTPKEEAAKSAENDGEKYDPFDESESNDSKSDKDKKDDGERDKGETPALVEPPPSPPNYSGMNLVNQVRIWFLVGGLVSCLGLMSKK